MRAEIKKIYSPDIDLATFRPQDPESFSFLLRIIAGPEGEEGEESFDVEICTPKWLLETYAQEEVVIGRHHLIVFEYNLERIIQTIKSFCASCFGETWKEVAEKLSRLGQWEFEDYRDPIST
ncbi:MAG: hypothetical protein DKINENOH_03942 [bacterium]|nr:hypothetical protein [bacterium]